MSKQIISLLVDYACIGLLCALSLLFLYQYMDAKFIDTSYVDWIIHAFRVRTLQEFGFTSWIHNWANGISLWKSYQFLPHYVTLITANLFNLEIPRAMVVLTIFCFMLTRVFLYVSLRILKVGPIAALICSVLSFGIAQFWGGVSDYSLMFAFAISPLMLLTWVYFTRGKLQYIFPYVAGFAFYVHPILGVISGALMLYSILFSNYSILSLKTFFQVAFYLVASSLFWYPILSHESYYYSTPVFASRDFLQLVLAPYSYFGLSIFLLGILFGGSALLFMKLPSKYSWAKGMYLFFLLYFVLVVVGLSTDLPHVISRFQFTRGITIIGIGILMAASVVFEKILRVKNMMLRGLVIFIVTLALIEGMWSAVVYAPYKTASIQDPVTTALSQKNRVSDNGRILTPEIGNSSFLAPLSIYYPYSYMGHMEPNQVAQRMWHVFIDYPKYEELPYASVQRAKDYLDITATSQLFLESESPLTGALNQDKQNYREVSKVTLTDNTYTLFETTRPAANGYLIDSSLQNNIKPFPTNLEFSDEKDQIALDLYVKNLDQTLKNTKNRPLQVRYPTNDSLSIGIPENRTGNTIYIVESFDPGWKAYFKDTEVKLTAAGPNFMQAHLGNIQGGGVLFLKHDWTLSWYASVFLIIFAPVALAIVNFSTYMFEAYYRKADLASRKLGRAIPPKRQTFKGVIS